MDPRAVLHPVGPQPARVYWLRRAFLLGAVAVAVAVIAVSCSGGSSSRNATHDARPVARPSIPAATSPTSTPSASATPHCRRADITVTASTDAPAYPPAAIPQLRVSIRNTSKHTCYLIESASRRTWTIVSGADTVWTTVGCQRSSAATRTTLRPDASVQHSFAWNRHRSGPNCTSSATEADPGTYQLSVVVSGVRSAPAVFRLTK